MNPDFRERAFLPVVLPLLVVGGFALFAVSLSRVLLAIPELSAALLALVIAGYVLVVSALIAARPHLSTRALGVGLVLGLVGVTAAGAAGAQAGIRPVEHGEEEAAGESGEEGEDDGGAAESADVPADALVFVADDIEYSEAPDTAEGGEVTLAIDNQGGQFHDVVLEETGEEVLGADGGETDVASTTLDAGTYTYYCSVPGHRDAGMEGTLEVQ